MIVIVIFIIQEGICVSFGCCRTRGRTCVIGSASSQSLLLSLLLSSVLLFLQERCQLACSVCLFACDLRRLCAHGCLLFDLWLAFELIIADRGSPPHTPQPLPPSPQLPRPVIHRVSPVTLSPSEVELERRPQSCPPTLPPRLQRDLYLPSHPPWPSASTAGVYQPAQGGGVCRREIQTGANRCRKHQ